MAHSWSDAVKWVVFVTCEEDSIPEDRTAVIFCALRDSKAT